MSVKIPIGKDDILEICIGGPRSKRKVYFNIWTRENLRGIRKTKKGFCLDAAIAFVVFEQTMKLLWIKDG